MTRNLKKKLNLTIREDVIEKARRVAEHRGGSLSSLIEDFLANLSADSEDTDWLAAFHKRYMKPSFREPSDAQLAEIRRGLRNKHS